MQRRDDPEAAAVFDFVSSFQDEREAGRGSTLAQWLGRYPGHEAAIAREWLALQEQSSEAPGAAASDKDLVGPYRILAELGRGGQGSVFLAQDTRIARRVALKVLGGQFDSVSEERRRRFRREAEVIARLEHPGICGIYDADIDGAPPYLAMRLVEGQTLAQLLARARARERPTRRSRTNGRRAPRSTCTRCCTSSSAPRALHAAHEAGVLHRDVKPGNLMVTPQGQPVLLDFGLAREQLSPDVTELTQPGDVFGTPAYMAPEQLEMASSELDRRCDVYALGAALYETLTLHRPFEAQSRAELYLAIARKPLPDPRRHNPALSTDVAVVLQTALEKDRARRYASALELAEDLRRIREYEPIRARPASLSLRFLRWTRRNPVLAATVATLAVGLSVALWALAGERAALRVALGRHLATRCAAVTPEDPAAALVLGVQACELAPNFVTRAALLEALGACRLETELRCGDATASAMSLAPDGAHLAVAFRAASDPRWPSRVRVFDLASRGAPLECEGSGEEYTGVAWMQEGARIAASTRAGKLVSWEAATGQRAAELELGGELAALAVARAGTRALAVGKDFVALCDLGTARVVARYPRAAPDGPLPRWRADEQRLYLANGTRLECFDAADGSAAGSCGLPSAIHSFDCAKESGRDLVLCGLADGSVAYVEDLRASAALELDPASEVDFVALGPAGRALACVGGNQFGGTFLVEPDGASPRELPIPSRVRVVHAAFSPDGRHVATASFDQSLRLWSVPELALEHVLRGNYRPQELGWTPDGARLWMRNTGNGGALWFADELPDTFRLAGCSCALLDLCVAPSGALALGVGDDGSARAWELARGRLLHSWSFPEEGGVRCAALAPSGTQAVLGCVSGALVRVDLGSGAELARRPADASLEPRALRFDADGARLLVEGARPRLLETGPGWRECTQPEPASAAVFLPGESVCVRGSNDGVLRAVRTGANAIVWERTLRTKKDEGEPLPIRALCAAADGKELCAVAGSEWIVRLSSRDGAEIERIRRPFEIVSMSYSPAGGQLLLVGRPGGGAFRLIEFDRGSKHALGKLEVNHLDDLVDGCFSPDGVLFATVSLDGVCYVRDARSILPVSRARLPARPRRIGWAGRSGEWKLLVACADGVHVFPVDPLPAARARAPRELSPSEVDKERRLADPLVYDG
ncbi:MAG: protein kinase [Planctomycetes bacterium]|nr:protein kinase [Planctomycetota bacterium]